MEDIYKGQIYTLGGGSSYPAYIFARSHDSIPVGYEEIITGRYITYTATQCSAVTPIFFFPSEWEGGEHGSTIPINNNVECLKELDEYLNTQNKETINRLFDEMIAMGRAKLAEANNKEAEILAKKRQEDIKLLELQRTIARKINKL